MKYPLMIPALVAKVLVRSIFLLTKPATYIIMGAVYYFVV